MPTNFGIGLGILGVLILLRVLRVGSMPRQLERAFKMQKRDPAAARQMMDEHFRKEAMVEKEQRARLWQAAQIDSRAARDLRRRLNEDLRVNAAARKDLGREPNASQILAQIDMDNEQIKRDLARLDALAQQLPS